MKENKTFLTWGLVVLGIAVGVVLGIVEGNGPLLSAFSGIFAGILIYVAIILLRARSTKEDSYEIRNEEHQSYRKRDAARSPRQRTQQTVQDANFQTPPKTR